MDTWDPAEVLNAEKMKTSCIGISMCVFTGNYHPDGSFDKYKRRIVFRGDRWYALYCNKTYAGCMEVSSLDVKTAFLYGLIPAGLTDADSPKQIITKNMPTVIRLRKCSYGLPHAPATFREHIDTSPRSFGFTPIVSDPRLYLRLLAEGTKAYVAVHVDDVGIAASTPELNAETMAEIRII